MDLEGLFTATLEHTTVVILPKSKSDGCVICLRRAVMIAKREELICIYSASFCTTLKWLDRRVNTTLGWNLSWRHIIFSPVTNGRGRKLSNPCTAYALLPSEMVQDELHLISGILQDMLSCINW